MVPLRLVVMKKLIYFSLVLSSFTSIYSIAGRDDDIEGSIHCIYPNTDSLKPGKNALLKRYIGVLKRDLQELSDKQVSDVLRICQDNFTLQGEVIYDINDRNDVTDGIIAMLTNPVLIPVQDDLVKNIKNLDQEKRGNGLYLEIQKRIDPKAAEESKIKQEKEENLQTAIRDYTPTYSKAYIANNITINLMWIYREINPDNLYIFPYPYIRQKETIDLFKRIKDWAQLYPQVIVWYDSQYVGPEAVNRTREKFNDQYEEVAQKIILKDIRTLSIVNENKDVFNHKSVYFRSDLVRVAISYEELKNAEKGKFLVYADLGIAPLNPDELLEPLSVVNLNEYGLVLATKRGTDRYENSFHIMGNNQTELLRALKSAVIDVNIKRISNQDFLESQRYAKDANKFDQVVYDSYQGMIRVLYGLLKKSDEKKCGSRWDEKNDQQLEECIWNEYGINVVPADSPSRNFIIDPLLKLKMDVRYFWFYPIMSSDKFTQSHFG